MPRASFVIPTKNSGKSIEQCLASLMPYYKQGHIAEIIIVDACSKDNTREIAAHFRVKILDDPSTIPNMTYAFEIGWRDAKGELIVFFDSDAYLGDGFLPRLFDFFQDTQMGVLGCDVQPVIGENKLSTVIEQWMKNDRGAHFSPGGPKGLGRLHHWISAKGNPWPTPHGPCHIVRRSCLEAVDGHRGMPYKVPPDEAISKRIVKRGWQTGWWVDSPVYHYTRVTLTSLLRQYAHNGQAIGLLYREEEFEESSFRKAVRLAGHLGTPVEGVAMAVRWREPLNLFIYPMAHYAFALGYINGLGRKTRPEERIP